MSNPHHERPIEMSSLPSRVGRPAADPASGAPPQQAEAIRHYRRALAALEAGRFSGLDAEECRRLAGQLRDALATFQ
jgi:hypothetical protein